MALAQRLLNWLDEKQIPEIEKRLLDGQIGGETAEHRLINYQAGVLFRKSLYRLRDAILEFDKAAEGEGDGGLEPMPEVSEGAKDED